MTRWQTLGMAAVATGSILVAACAQSTPRETPVPEPTATPTTAPTQTPAPEQTPPPAPTPTPTAAPTATPQPTPTAIPVSEVPGTVQRFGLFLEIEGITDESVIRGESILARGNTSPEAVLSINGVIVPVAADGTFEVLLSLDPGPNVIEVVASDLDGNEESLVLAVVSLQEEPA